MIRLLSSPNTAVHIMRTRNQIAQYADSLVRRCSVPASW